MSQDTLDHEAKHQKASWWWYILLAVIFAIVLILADRNYYSIIIKYEFNNLISNSSALVDFKIQNNTGDINNISIEKKYIYEIDLDYPSTERLLRGGKFYINLSPSLKEKLPPRFNDREFLVIADYKNLNMVEIGKFAMSYLDHMRTWAGNEAMARQIEQNASPYIDIVRIDEISKEPGCDCNLKSIPQVVEMIKIRKCQCLLSDIFYKRQNNVNYLIYCGLDPTFYLRRPEFTGSRSDVSCEVRAETNYYTARFYIKRDFLTDFDDLATFLLNRFKLI